MIFSSFLDDIMVFATFYCYWYHYHNQNKKHTLCLDTLYLQRVHAQLELLMRFTFFNLERERLRLTTSEAAKAQHTVSEMNVVPLEKSTMEMGFL